MTMSHMQASASALEQPPPPPAPLARVVTVDASAPRRRGGGARIDVCGQAGRQPPGSSCTGRAGTRATRRRLWGPPAVEVLHDRDGHLARVHLVEVAHQPPHALRDLPQVNGSKPCDAGVWPIYEKPTMQGRWPVRGCFCSPGCVMRFLVSSRIPGADPAWRHNTAMVIRARLKLPPQRAVPIAPPPMALRSHGGHMALEEWRTLAGYGGALPKYDEFTRVRARRAGVRLRGEDAHHHPRREQQGRRGPPVAVDSAPCAGAGP